MDKLQIIYESYNHVIESGYEKLFAENKGDEILKLDEERINNLLDLKIKDWEITPIKGLGNLSPQEFFGDIGELEHAVDAFKTAAGICDSGIPRLLFEKLKTLGENAVDELMKLAGEACLTDGTEDDSIPLAAIRTLGRMKAAKAIDGLISLMYNMGEDRENIIEEISDALVEIGEPVLEPIISRISEAAEIGCADEYVLNALVKVGKTNKSDRIFMCLKSAFGKMDDKILGALCLGDYGDGRAIPALRGYIEKNRAAIDKGTFLEVAAAIKRLGGNIDDLVKGTAL